MNLRLFGGLGWPLPPGLLRGMLLLVLAVALPATEAPVAPAGLFRSPPAPEASGPSGLDRSPEARAYQRLRVLGNVESMYGPLFRQLNLGADPVGRLKELLVDRQLGSGDLLASLRQQGLDPRDPEAKAQLDAVMAGFRADSDARLLDLLGPGSYAALKEYERRWPQRNTVNVVAQRLAGTVSPLREEQIERLIHVLTPAAGEGRALIPAATGGVMVHITDQAVNAAKDILEEAQLARFVALKQEQDARLKLAEATRRAAKSAPPAIKAEEP